MIKEINIPNYYKIKYEEQTKVYQQILQEMQREIDDLQRNCDFFNEQMDNAVERTVVLNKILDEIETCLHFRYSDATLGRHGTELKNRLLKILERIVI